MSDFLSNFSGNNYEKTRQDKLYDKKKQEAEEASKIPEAEPVIEKPEPERDSWVRQTEKEVNSPVAPPESTKPKPIDDEDLSVEELLRKKKKERKNRKPKETVAKLEPVAAPERRQETQPDTVPGEELTEIDTSYRRKKIMKYVILLIIALLACGVGYFTYYQLTRVEVPDFTGKELSEARAWGNENDVKLNVKQNYDFGVETNQIISQDIKNKKIKKGSELVVDASLGADPEEKIALPEFDKMSLESAKEWIAEHKAENLSVIEEYNDTKPTGEFIKLEMSSKEIKAEDYVRKNKAKLYYSKGAEVLEKNIEVLDFVGKVKTEAEDWAKKNELTLEATENDSDTVEAGKIISQGTGKGEKVAKKDKFTIVVSSGKAFVVPDFSHKTMMEAEANTESAQLTQIYSNDIPYGQFISQSVPAGEKYKEEEKPAVQVVYSIGKPFLRDLRNSTIEGDLQKIFYEEYQSKGAPITYEVYYVDSESTKGTVVDMSRYNEFVPIDAVIRIGVSKGNLQPKTEDASNNAANNMDFGDDDA